MHDAIVRRRTTLLDAADARLDGEFVAREMERALEVGLWCARDDPSGRRPSIEQAMNISSADLVLLHRTRQ
jgi:hypothetical protein